MEEAADKPKLAQSLIITCRQIYSETQFHLYTSSTFSGRFKRDFDNWARLLSIPQRNAVASIQLRLRPLKPTIVGPRHGAMPQWDMFQMFGNDLTFNFLPSLRNIHLTVLPKGRQMLCNNQHLKDAKDSVQHLNPGVKVTIKRALLDTHRVRKAKTGVLLSSRRRNAR
ncbi:hypothetical protein GQ44DRAFT_714157 [Phaeosphaeriaceae sp. PMI808]|nr:hypothetical protein GQ44DRAFT_714157 [Phaeosphaeriaceae sp. PMI808]